MSWPAIAVAIHLLDDPGPVYVGIAATGRDVPALLRRLADAWEYGPEDSAPGGGCGGHVPVGSPGGTLPDPTFVPSSWSG